jgi:hypothetical protein
MYMPIFDLNVLEQGCSLVEAIEAVDTMESRDPFERQVAGLLQAAFERRLEEIADNVSGWDVEKILMADACTGLH